MKKIVILACVLFFGSGIAWAQDWPMMQRDATHSGYSAEGFSAPLKENWRALSGSPDNSFTTWPVVRNGVVYVSSGPGIIAVDALTGKRKWDVQPSEGQTIVSPAVDDVAVYMPVPFGRLLALAVADGKELWRFQAADSLDASPTLADGRIYIGSEEAKTFYAINAADGSEAWNAKLDFEPDSVAAVSQGIVVFTMEDLNSRNTTYVVALDAGDGHEIWRIQQQVANSSPSILGDMVILGGGDLNVYALDLKTGKEVWKTSVPGKFNTQNFPAIAFGDVFMADRIGNIYRLDGTTGKRKWLFDDAEVGFVQSFPVIAGKTLFIGNGAGWLYALDTDDGRLLWKHQVGGFVLSGAADEKHFYFGVKFGKEGLYAYGHDPKGKLAPPPVAEPNIVTTMVRALLVFLLIFGAAVVFSKRKRKASNLEA
ncbi:MAG: PQQ-binding-like beta-propeller repeat protein [Actinomycetota bacterium]